MKCIRARATARREHSRAGGVAQIASAPKVKDGSHICGKTKLNGTIAQPPPGKLARVPWQSDRALLEKVAGALGRLGFTHRPRISENGIVVARSPRRVAAVFRVTSVAEPKRRVPVSELEQCFSHSGVAESGTQHGLEGFRDDRACPRGSTSSSASTAPDESAVTIWDCTVAADRVRYLSSGELQLYLAAHLRRVLHRRGPGAAEQDFGVQANAAPNESTPRPESAVSVQLFGSTSATDLTPARTGQSFPARPPRSSGTEQESTDPAPAVATAADLVRRLIGASATWRASADELAAVEKSFSRTRAEGRDACGSFAAIKQKIGRRLGLFEAANLPYRNRLSCRDAARVLDCLARRSVEIDAQGVCDRALLSALQAELLFSFPKLRPQEIANVLWATGKVPSLHENARLVFRHAFLVVLPNVEVFQPRHLANILWSCGAVQHLDQQVFQKILNRLRACYDVSQERTITGPPPLMASEGRSDLDPRSRWNKEDTSCHKNANLQDFANACWACARVNHFDHSFLKAAQQMYLKEARGGAAPVTVATFPLSPPVLRKRGIASSSSRGASLQEASSICWAVACCGKVDDEFWVHKRSLATPVPDFVDTSFFSSVADALVREARLDRPSLNDPGKCGSAATVILQKPVIITLHAFATLGLYHKQLVFEVLPQLNVDTFSPQDVANVVWSLAYLMQQDAGTNENSRCAWSNATSQADVSEAGGPTAFSEHGSEEEENTRRWLRPWLDELVEHARKRIFVLPRCEERLVYVAPGFCSQKTAVDANANAFSSSQLCNFLWGLSVLTVVVRKSSATNRPIEKNSLPNKLLSEEHLVYYHDLVQTLHQQGKFSDTDLVELFCAATVFPELLASRANGGGEISRLRRCAETMFEKSRTIGSDSLLEEKVKKKLEDIVLERLPLRNIEMRMTPAVTIKRQYRIPGTHLDADFLVSWNEGCAAAGPSNHATGTQNTQGGMLSREAVVLIEVDGPSHFVYDLEEKTFSPNGVTQCKRILLGQHLVHVARDKFCGEAGGPASARSGRVLSISWLQLDNEEEARMILDRIISQTRRL
ncbi:unnamed protein product [Amoebophrya sp. A120]|nr:unnamed protein product [Amoebophrya sp. A120]|eukprot:GSA120T00007928001.1